MPTPPLSRRAAIATGLAVTTGLLGASAAPVPKGDNKPWVGKTVLPKKSDPFGVYGEKPFDAPPGDDGKPVTRRCSQCTRTMCWR